MDQQKTFEMMEYLRELRGEKVNYIPNPGNGGDSVIATGTYQAFERAGLSYVLPPPSSLDATKAVVVYGGGGNLVGPLSFSSRFVAKHHRKAKKLVILPHTVKDVDVLLGELGSNVDLICREQTSYNYVKNTTRANVFLAHDMAFGIDVNRILEAADWRSFKPGFSSYIVDRYLLHRSVPSWVNFRRALRFPSQLDFIRNHVGTSEELCCFRNDGESSGAPVPDNNVDLSEIFTFGTESPRIAALATYAIFSCLSQYKIIKTDRLHMAISGALLGLDVRFKPNNYFKCKAVYDFSMRGRYANVTWQGDE